MSQDPEASRALGLAHGQVCYLQLPAADRNRAAAFYRAVFGWQTETHHPDFESPGLIGQWVEGRRPARDAGPVIWLAVADMNETLEQVVRQGGPHPGHDRRPGRQPHRPGRPRAIAIDRPVVSRSCHDSASGAWPGGAGVTAEVACRAAVRIADICTPSRGCRYPQ
jgi:hypothetical protein